MFLPLILQMSSTPAALRDICPCQPPLQYVLFPLLLCSVSPRGTLDKAWYQKFIKNTIWLLLIKLLNPTPAAYVRSSSVYWHVACCVSFILFSAVSNLKAPGLLVSTRQLRTKFRMLSWTSSSAPLRFVEMFLCERDERSFLLSWSVWAELAELCAVVWAVFLLRGLKLAFYLCLVFVATLRRAYCSDPGVQSQLVGEGYFFLFLLLQVQK